MHDYRLYGFRLRSQWPLPCPAETGPGSADIELIDGPAHLFSSAALESRLDPNPRRWVHGARLSDGSIYLRWSELFEFLIAPNGRRIMCRTLASVSPEVFHTHLLRWGLSFALLKLGIAPFHSTVVVINGKAVGFVGESGCGKSTLGAAFLLAGYPLLTDDLLIVKEEGHGLSAYPSLPGIKLFPEIARILLGDQVLGTPMSPLTPKLIIPLDRQRAYRAAAPLEAIYVLAGPSPGPQNGKVEIESLSRRRAAFELLKNGFNSVIEGAAHFQLQFTSAVRIACAVPVKLLLYPRSLTALPAARDAVLSDFTP